MKYIVTVTRISYGQHKEIVEAGTEEEAMDLALDHAEDHFYHEYHAEYEIDEIWEAKTHDKVL